MVDGIAAERELLRGVREEADLVIDTSALNVHELRARMHDAFGADAPATLRVNVVSFGYKYGLPVDADIVADCRFLPNPRWVADLAPLTGQDERVRDYVLSQPGAAEFLDSYLSALRVVLAGYEREGKRFVTLAIGCTGGKHRSVAVAEQIASQLERQGPGRPGRAPGSGARMTAGPADPGARSSSPATTGQAAWLAPSVRPLNPKVAALGGGHGLFAAAVRAAPGDPAAQRDRDGGRRRRLQRQAAPPVRRAAAR